MYYLMKRNGRNTTKVELFSPPGVTVPVREAAGSTTSITKTYSAATKVDLVTSLAVYSIEGAVAVVDARSSHDADKISRPHSLCRSTTR